MKKKPHLDLELDTRISLKNIAKKNNTAILTQWYNYERDIYSFSQKTYVLYIIYKFNKSIYFIRPGKKKKSIDVYRIQKKKKETTTVTNIPSSEKKKIRPIPPIINNTHVVDFRRKKNHTLSRCILSILSLRKKQRKQ